MSHQVPRFTIQNYLALMNKEFSSGENTQRFSIRELFSTLQAPFRKTYGDIDARELGPFLATESPTGTTYFNGKNIPTKELIPAIKLLCPSLRCCHYFLRDVGHGTHTGIDIMLPHQTPIISFTDGEVVRIKTWDGVTKNEGNCIAIKAPDGYILGYEHLERIDVTVGQTVKQGDQIGTCGSTGNSTQYHLHLQVDKGFAPFHPYRSADIDDIRKYTIDPLPYLRAQNPGQLYVDMPNELHYEKAIRTLTKGLIIKGYNRHIAPDQSLQRYEAALMIDRTLRLYSIYDNRTLVTQAADPYSDVNNDDQELLEALDKLKMYGIMKGHNNNFYPHKELQGEELLALLGRIFYGLSDTNTATWYDNYVIAFIEKEIISDNRGYIGKAIPRKEVFLLLSTLLQRENIFH